MSRFEGHSVRVNSRHPVCMGVDGWMDMMKSFFPALILMSVGLFLGASMPLEGRLGVPSVLLAQPAGEFPPNPLEPDPTDPLL
ncbi:MAG: hypothetical protein SFW36_08365, partial [Leptolyngbyaceae cyanobacterium bins.59]|nr:hypothetical protein [Leptolyngbyaceae cyanobacterium bins.59]